MYMRWVRATPPVDSGMGWGAGTVLLTLLLILLPSGDLGHQLDRPLVQVATSRATSRQTRSGTAIKTIASARQDSFSGIQGGLLPLPQLAPSPAILGPTLWSTRVQRRKRRWNLDPWVVLDSKAFPMRHVKRSTRTSSVEISTTEGFLARRLGRQSNVSKDVKRPPSVVTGPGTCTLDPAG